MDRQTDRMIVHSGGQATTHPAPNRTTWALDLVANTWSMLRVDPTDWTPGLMYHAGAFDPVGRTLVVFGGRSDDFGFSILQDTWSLDVATEQWTQILSANVAPEARINARMLHDAERNRMIMFGGFTDQTIGASNDVWVFDLASFEWSRSSAGDVFNREPIAACEFPGDFVTADLSSPERRRGHVFVQAGAIAILHGGRTDCGFANDTWHFDLETLAWTPIHQSAQGLTCPRKGEVNCSGPLARLCD